MSTATVASLHEELLAAIQSEEEFLPRMPHTIEETGLPTALVESLVCKHLSIVGSRSGRGIAEEIGLPFGILENLFHSLRSRQILVYSASAPLNDHIYCLTEEGRQRTQSLFSACAYVGPAPVPLSDYVVSVNAQTIRAEAPRRDRLAQAFADISVDSNLFADLGPAVNSGAGLFLYGAPGNGKSTLARRITSCFGQYIWIPYALIVGGQLIKLHDSAYHEVAKDDSQGIVRNADYDRRWVKIRRPTVVIGGEMTMDCLELRHDPHSNVSEAPLQLKSNCGCLLIDDFGRQRIEPAALLNRWIIPLENRHDFLTLVTGKKFQVPFEQLIIFSTNLEPSSLADEAFLRRIPYKIEIADPDEAEFHRLFQAYAHGLGFKYEKASIDYLLAKHYLPRNRPMRRCHPRDLLGQIQNYCRYNDLPMEMRPEYFDRIVKSYFTVVAK
ncbi:MAG: AAA family ATPase [Thermoguttaceae bacterium]|jgi:predicted ATPase with chaperone activity